MTATPKLAEPVVSQTIPMAAAAVLRRIPLAELHESPLNPREHYDTAALDELVASLLQTGQLTPIIVRPRKAGGYEIAAGHRRYRAALQARRQSPEGAAYHRLQELEAKVVALDDRAFVEVLTVENLQRDDLHPLEEASGFKQLMEKGGYDVAKIAARIGRSTKYVYDRIKLLQLVPEARKMFLAGEFEAGHAIILARLPAADQKRAIDKDAEGRWGLPGGLFEHEQADADPNLPAQEQMKLDDGVKPVSVRELQTWVDDNVRMKPEDVDPFLFPDTAQLLKDAQEEELKVIHITHDYRVPDAARDEKQRTYGEQAWKRADGKLKSRSCDHSVIGVVVAGPGRGEAFRVCIAKEKCKTHWAAWQRERTARPKSSGGSTPASRQDDSDRWQREEAKRTEERARWNKAKPEILNAIAKKIAVAPAGPASGLADDVLNACINTRPMKVNPAVPRGRTFEDLIRHAAFQLWVQEVDNLAPGYYQHNDAVKAIKSLGVDVAKIVDQVAPKPAPEKKPVAKKASKKRGK